MTAFDAAERVQVDLLHAVGVHEDVPGLAEEPQPRPVGRHVEGLGAGGAVEVHRVVAGLALDDVAAVAGVPDEDVVAGAHDADVAAAVAVGRVVPGAAEGDLVARAAEQRVVVAPAREGRALDVGEDAVGLVDAHAVVAAARLDDDLVEAGAVEGGLGRAVVVGVELQAGGDARLEPQGDAVVAAVAGDEQGAARHLGGRRRAGLVGGECGSAGQQGAGGEQAGDRAAADHGSVGDAGHDRFLSVVGDLPLKTPPRARLFPAYAGPSSATRRPKACPSIQ